VLNDRNQSRSHTRGKDAERYAADYLRRLGYQVLNTNVRLPGGEIDIVAEEDGILVFVEVRARKSGLYGTAEESVGPQKRRRIFQAAEAYLQRLEDGSSRASRIDVVAIQLDRQGRPVEVDLIKNALEQP